MLSYKLYGKRDFMRFCLLIMTGALLAAPRRSPPPVSIKLDTAKLEQIVQTQTYLGSVEASNSAKLALERSGVVSKIFVADNSFVKKGTQILQINPDLIEANLASAAAKLKLAETEQERLKKLYFSKAISASTYDQAVNDYKVAYANYLSIKAQLAQTILTAPFSGTVGFINFHVGEYVSAGNEITDLHDLTKLKVSFYMPQEQFHNLKSHQQIQIEFSGKTYIAKSMQKSASIDSKTRLFKVEASLPKAKIAPGAFVPVNVKLKNNLLMVPENAVGFDASGAYIYTFAEQPTKVKVSLGLQQNGKIALKSGLKPGEKYVAVGQFKLYPNAPLIITS